MKLAWLALPLAAALSTPAAAGELFGGLYVHDVPLPTNLSGLEKGVDVVAGYRGDGIAGTRIQPYLVGGLNTAGDTSFAAIGLSAKFGGRAYVRPGVGIAIHNGSADRFFRRDRIAFGSRFLFEPELAVGVQVNERLSVEASWIHLSHAQVFGGENPGLDDVGVRLNLKL